VPLRLNPLHRLTRWRPATSGIDKIYGAIVAQARLPIFYQGLGVPDTLDGRFALLSLHLFAVLHRLRGEAGEAPALAQALMDRFSGDMETVLREQGVSDLRIPKTMRGLAASSHRFLAELEAGLAGGEGAFAASIAARLPLPPETAGLSSRRLASYLWACVNQLERQPLASIEAGALDFPEVAEA
jgi:cytochrome b pre-mRNA-processing protein 3